MSGNGPNPNSRGGSSNIANLFKRYPAFLGGGVVLALRYTFSDIIVQYAEQRVTVANLNDNSGNVNNNSDKEERTESFFSQLDSRRTAVLASFGFLYGVGPGYLCYSKLYPMIFRNAPLRAAIFDVTIQCNLIYYPLYYMVYDLIKDPCIEDEEVSVASKTYNIFQRAIAMQQKNVYEDTIAMSAFWIPAHYLNFKYVPLHYRMAFMGIVGVGWGGILSFMRGN